MAADLGGAFVTWSQVGAISSAIGLIFVTCAGIVMNQVRNLGRRIDDNVKHVDEQRELIEANHREVLRYYATQDMVTQVEKRLTETVNRIGEDIRQLTGSIQGLFTEISKR